MATCTPAIDVVLEQLLPRDVFVVAVGGFSPQMIELAPALTQWFACKGCIVANNGKALREAGDLLQAGIDLDRLRTQASCAAENSSPSRGPV